jgi:hypothetical protein
VIVGRWAAGRWSRAYLGPQPAPARPSLSTLTEQDRLAIEDPEIAAEQFVWLIIGAPSIA